MAGFLHWEHWETVGFIMAECRNCGRRTKSASNPYCARRDSGCRLLYYRWARDPNWEHKARETQWDNPESVAKYRHAHRVNHIRSYALNGAKTRAERKGVPFMLALADVPEVPEVCPVFGTPLVIGTGHPTGNSLSLDRIKPELGYVPGNVHWISNRANSIKSDATIAELRMIADYFERMAA